MNKLSETSSATDLGKKYKWWKKSFTAMLFLWYIFYVILGLGLTPSEVNGYRQLSALENIYLNYIFSLFLPIVLLGGFFAFYFGSGKDTKKSIYSMRVSFHIINSIFVIGLFVMIYSELF